MRCNHVNIWHILSPDRLSAVLIWLGAGLAAGLLLHSWWQSEQSYAQFRLRVDPPRPYASEAPCREHPYYHDALHRLSPAKSRFYPARTVRCAV
ncbi:hypothetical protein HNV11_19850 [Spirosoma taeanense]|uniref:Uncharacterized protein n=1 Tax=Spirosoma taeanense TaxID=2735870 RepID=A0A6M5YER0_9BACT|nr:hypothetical protein [Spirosoma taeanense]QJW91472.1 hypothetical protein HNV11_19850 [Spirosoma taeanense]